MGYYIIGQYTSVAWYKDKSEADKECQRMNYRGGTIYKVVSDTDRINNRVSTK